MSPLRQQMIREMQLRRFTPRTCRSYLTAIYELAAFCRQSPDGLSVEQVRSFVHDLLTQRKLAGSTCNLYLSAIRFFYREVLRRRDFDLNVPCKQSGKLPEVYSREELVRLFKAPRAPKHRILLMTTYATGLRLSEVTHLRPIHIHSERMVIRVDQGKGRKDRYTLLSAALLGELREYWKAYRPGEWLFPNRDRTGPMPRGTAQHIFYSAKKRAGLQRGQGIHTLRHCFATHLLEAGVDVRTIQTLMGHRSILTTMRYLQVTRQRIEQLQSPFDLLRMPNSHADAPATPDVEAAHPENQAG